MILSITTTRQNLCLENVISLGHDLDNESVVYFSDSL